MSAGRQLPVGEAFQGPRDRLVNSGEMLRFIAGVLRDVFTLRVLRFIGETLRQAGILIVSSTLVIWGLVFIIGLQCGIEGTYLLRAQGAPQYAGVFSAWCELRELVPLVFGYMMAAKVMVVNIVSVHIVGMLGTQLFWGANPRAPIGG